MNHPISLHAQHQLALFNQIRLLNHEPYKPSIKLIIYNFKYKQFMFNQSCYFFGLTTLPALLQKIKKERKKERLLEAVLKI